MRELRESQEEEAITSDENGCISSVCGSENKYFSTSWPSSPKCFNPRLNL